MSKGFIVEETVSGCDCMPLSIMSWDYKGEDYWYDLTDGIDKYKVCGYTDIEGVCPKCNLPVFYNEYLVVT